MEEINKPHYKIISEVSRFAAKTGDKWGWDFQKEEGEKNADNPGRAITKAAPYVLGGLFSAFGGGAAAGANAAGAGAEAAGTVAAEEAAKQAALELAKQEMLNSAQYAAQEGLLSSTAPTVGSGLLGGQGGVGMGSTMSMAPGPGVVAPGKQFAAMLDTAAINSGVPNAAPGYWNPMVGKSGAQKFAMKQGLSMMSPQQQQQPPAPPPRQQQSNYQPEPMQMPYGDPYGGLLGMSEEEKMRLRMMGYNV